VLIVIVQGKNDIVFLILTTHEMRFECSVCMIVHIPSWFREMHDGIESIFNEL
jgi:hypothetical protein